MISINNLLYIEDSYYVTIGINGIFKCKSKDSIIGVNNSLSFTLKLNNLISSNNTDINYIKSFTTLLYNMVYNSQFGLVDYLYLKGIGFKVLSSSNILFFKLNYSHYIYYVLPLEMKVKVKKKNKLLKFSFFQEHSSRNVLNKLSKFRLTNIYTQKGIFKRNQEIYKKEGKKKQL